MPSHQLLLDQRRSREQWLLTWDPLMMTLKTPGGETVLEFPTELAHRILDVGTFDTEGKISFVTPIGLLKFNRNRHASRDVRELVVNGLRWDGDFRVAQKKHARTVLPRSLAMLLVGGSLFGLYCWWASWAKDPPKGHWLYSVGWLIHLILLVLLAGTVAGACGTFLSSRQLRRVRKLERSLDTGSGEIISIQPLSPRHFARFNRIQPTALLGSPSMFGSRYAGDPEMRIAEWLGGSALRYSERSVCFMAWEDGAACGIIAALFELNETGNATLASLWIAPDHRRRGIGRSLIEKVFAWAAAQKAKNVNLMVPSNNQDAIEFCEQLGFAKTGMTKVDPLDQTLHKIEMSRPVELDLSQDANRA